VVRKYPAIVIPPRGSLGKSRRAIPEVWIRIIHIATDHVKGSLELREQTLEVALEPKGPFENGNIGVLTRRVPAERDNRPAPNAVSGS